MGAENTPSTFTARPPTAGSGTAPLRCAAVARNTMARLVSPAIAPPE